MINIVKNKKLAAINLIVYKKNTKHFKLNHTSL